jgi:hypothetical protein
LGSFFSAPEESFIDLYFWVIFIALDTFISLNNFRRFGIALQWQMQDFEKVGSHA